MNLHEFATERGSKSMLASSLGVPPQLVGQWASGVRPIPIERCVSIERATNATVTRRDLRPEDWHEIWPELEEVERLRAEVAQLLERLRKYEPNGAPALSTQAPVAINSEVQEGAHG